MNVIWLLLKASWLNVSIAILTGLISGGCSAMLISLINRAISDNSNGNLVWYFAGLAILALLSGFVSQFLLIYLSQEAVYNLRLSLSRGILSTPLRIWKSWALTACWQLSQMMWERFLILYF
jgi:putative ATP-binding cassette transporter